MITGPHPVSDVLVWWMSTFFSSYVVRGVPPFFRQAIRFGHTKDGARAARGRLCSHLSHPNMIQRVNIF